MEKAPTGGEPNPFMGRNLEDNPFKIDPTKNPFKGYERPTLAKKPSVKVAPLSSKAKEAELAVKFTGPYKAARTKMAHFFIGRSGGYSDFKNFTNVTSEVRKKMVELRDKTFPKNQEFVNQQILQTRLNALKRGISYMNPNDRTATNAFLKEIKDKMGMEPKI